jgi:hypothetical protein
VRGVVPTLGDDRPPSPDIEALSVALREGLLDGLVPEATLAEMARRPRGARAPANGAKQLAADSADRAGRGRH